MWHPKGSFCQRIKNPPVTNTEKQSQKGGGLSACLYGCLGAVSGMLCCNALASCFTPPVGLEDLSEGADPEDSFLDDAALNDSVLDDVGADMDS
ncbi:hypothetical protein AVEN_261711-1 [Araneus ventricosus]|uniref:Uncharacterized protein n=1 Tax=Araneus ventricosus TaxID=182803 RepID=A0A4Y2DUP6_ARAVE|nr:hypothetical protein AVEN_261711-1 [Araneus ventricosus]